MPWYCLLLTALLLATWPARAQPTNQEVYQDLAVHCLAEVPGTAQAFTIDAPAVLPYVRTALAAHWAQQGRTLYLADSLFQQPAVPRLRYEVEQVRVDYERAGRRRLQRTVTLALRYAFAAPDGRLLHDDRCADTYSDTIPRSAREALESSAYPETQGEAPHGGWWRHYLEPALLAAATVVTAYLFFNLRGERSDDEL